MIKKRTRPQPRVREREISPERSDSAQTDAQCNSLSELLELRKFRRARQGIDSSKLTQGDGKKKRPKPDDDAQTPVGGLRPGAQVSDGSDSECEKAAKTRRAVRANNFTQQTNALDVDKHMMSYIEENMKLRRGRGQAGEEGAKAGGSTQEDFFNDLDSRYKVERKPGEEGSVTNSLSMLTAIPEVDLGMDTRLKNIEETEKAKLILSQDRAHKRPSNDPEAHLAATRFYRPSLRLKSDADIIRDAKREAMGLPPAPEEEERSRGPQMATDELVMERFKKRMRK
ncbi:hepatocellular carcinoma-associated antigen 59-domain-containing protein [Gloeopeniophorella convolvens]|nr:hepatocellular carcinoma-associated antigen 59-domain-containing protein [Gloeopeniophorella convolvens]